VARLGWGVGESLELGSDGRGAIHSSQGLRRGGDLGWAYCSCGMSVGGWLMWGGRGLDIDGCSKS